MGKFKYFLPVFITTVNCDIQYYKTNTSDEYTVEYMSLGATFGPDLPDSGLFGILQLSDPINGCSTINKTDIEPSVVGNRTFFPILLVKRGECQFDKKVNNGQDAAYQAVIVFDNKPNDRLIPMGSQTEKEPGISSVFTSFESGLALQKLLEEKPVYVKITPDGYVPYIPRNFLLPFAMAVGSCLLIMLVSTVVKLVRDWRKSRRGRLSRRKLNQLPIVKFKHEEHADLYDCCAICLEDFKNGDKIRELPCKHGYHKSCIDPWLTSNRKVCPLCKRTVLPSSDDSDVSDSEEAPLLENEVTPNEDERTPRVVTWARAFANHIRDDSGSDNPSSGPRRSQSVDGMIQDSSHPRRTRRNRRDRTISDRSYESTGELTDNINDLFINETSTPVTTVATITSNASIEIRPRSHSVDYTSSTNGDDESTPRVL